MKKIFFLFEIDTIQKKLYIFMCGLQRYLGVRYG